MTNVPNMDKNLEMITEVIQGIIAAMAVGSLVAIAIIDVLLNRTFTEPTTLSALAGAAVGFYYGQRNQRRQQEVISAMTDRIINGGQSK